jgi:hypothetical protein
MEENPKCEAKGMFIEGWQGRRNILRGTYGVEA